VSDIEKAYDFHAFCHEVITNEIAHTELDRLKSENAALKDKLAKANADQPDLKKAIACAQWFSNWGERFDEMDFPQTAIDEAKQILQGVFKVPTPPKV
jgi:hypothetical protein